MSGLHTVIIKYNTAYIEDELAAAECLYVYALDYLKVQAKGLYIPASIRNLTSMVLPKTSKLVDYYFEPYDTHVQKQSLYKMYDATVGAIDEKRFNKMLKQCDKIIARGLYGKKLLSRAGNWVGEDSKDKRTVVKNIRLKLNH